MEDDQGGTSGRTGHDDERGAARTPAAPFEYLPPSEPSDNPAAPRVRGVHTLVTWIVLVAVFLGVYTMFSVDPGAGTAWRDRALTFAWVAWPFALLLVCGLWFARQLRGGSLLAERLEPGSVSLAAGQVDRAIEQIRGVIDQYAQQPGFAAMVRAALAGALIRRGSFAEATDVLLAVERGRGLQFGSIHRNLSAVYLAWVLALRGDLAAAEPWLAETDRRLRRLRDGNDRTHVAAIRAMTAMTLAARRGDLDEAGRMFDAFAPRLEASLPVTTMKAAWLVRAFVAARWDGPRELGAAEPWLRLIRRARPDEVDFVAREWPEMQSFLASAR